MLCLHVFRQTGPLRRVDCSPPPPVCHIRWRHHIKCLVQGNNKQACRLVLHTVVFVRSAKQGSCENHFLNPFGMTRLGEMNPRSIECEADVLTTTLLRRLMTLCIMGLQPLKRREPVDEFVITSSAKNFAFVPSELNNNLMSLHKHYVNVTGFQVLGQMPSGVQGAKIFLVLSLKKCNTKQPTTETAKGTKSVHYFHSKLFLLRYS